MKKLYKGFSFVEITTVMLIMAIIFAITVKGKLLMLEANWKRDISKISQVSTALNLYYLMNRNNFIRQNRTESGNTLRARVLSIATLIDENFLTEETLILSNFKKERASQRLTEPLNYNISVFDGCEGGRAEGSFTIGSSKERYICAGIKNVERVSNSITTTISNYQLCILEAMIDDKNLINGIGRLFNATDRSIANGRTIIFDNCSLKQNDTTFNSNGWFYVFQFETE